MLEGLLVPLGLLLGLLFVLLVFVGLPYLLLRGLLGTIQRYAQSRYSIGELWLLVTVAGVAMGLTAKFLPREVPWPYVFLVSGLAGAAILWGGSWGLHLAERLEPERALPRARLILSGMLLAPLFFAFLFLFWLAVTLGHWPFGLLAATVLAVAFVYCRAMDRLVARARRKEEEQGLAQLRERWRSWGAPRDAPFRKGLRAAEWEARREAREARQLRAADAPSDVSDGSDRSDRSDKSDGSDASASPPGAP